MPPFLLTIAHQSSGDVVRRSVELPSASHALAEMDRIEREAAGEGNGRSRVAVTARDCAGRTLTRDKGRSGVFHDVGASAHARTASLEHLAAAVSIGLATEAVCSSGAGERVWASHHHPIGRKSGRG